MSNFEKIRDFLLHLGYDVRIEDPKEELFVINDEDAGICNMIIDCEEPLLIIEQHIADVKDDVEVFKKLLQKNRDIIHGAFVLDETGTKLIYRDTLELENINLNELKASIDALTLVLVEYYDELLSFSTLN